MRIVVKAKNIHFSNNQGIEAYLATMLNAGWSLLSFQKLYENNDVYLAVLCKDFMKSDDKDSLLDLDLTQGTAGEQPYKEQVA